MSAPTAPSSLAEALAAFQAAVPRVEKGNVGVIPGKDGKAGYKYEYADLSEITSVALPLLGQHGLSWSTKPTVLDNGAFVLEYRLRHTGGEEDIGMYPLPDPSRTQAQQVGSAITYARRYALCCVTGIAPGADDDDGEKAQQAPSESWERATPAAPRAQRQTAAQRPGTKAEQPPAAEAARSAERPSAGVLGATKKAQVEWWVNKIGENGDGELDASSFLTEEDAEVLGDRLDSKVNLDDLCAAVLGYWETHGQGPRAAPDAAVA